MKKVLITGATSGIGEACAWKFAELGWDLVISARRQSILEEMVKEIQKKHSVRVSALTLDVSNRKSIDDAFEKKSELFQDVSVLVNNAGLARGMDPIQSGKPEDWDIMIDTNVKGLLYMTHVILPGMLEKKEGHIINIGSVAGRWTYPKGNVYAATKFAVRAITESLRYDLLGTGIRVTEISPGMVETSFSEVRLGDKERAKAVYSGMTPLTAEDIAEAVIWSALRPKHVNIQDIVIYPTDQASPTVVHRS